MNTVLIDYLKVRQKTKQCSGTKLSSASRSHTIPAEQINLSITLGKFKLSHTFIVCKTLYYGSQPTS